MTLLLGDERHDMRPGDYACFPAGRKVGHSFLNGGTGPCSYLMIGERNRNDVCVMADSNKMQVRALRTARSIFNISGVRGYLDGEGSSAHSCFLCPREPRLLPDIDVVHLAEVHSRD